MVLIRLLWMKPIFINLIRINCMLELLPTSENRNQTLSPDSSEAMICNYQFTFCCKCVETNLLNVCPNCGSGFERRPIRLKANRERHPADTIKTYQPVDEGTFKDLLDKYSCFNPKDR